MKERNYTPAIWGLSILIVIIILGLNYLPRSTNNTIFGFDAAILPLLNAMFNGLAFLFLVGALIAIIKRNVDLHRKFIFAAFITTFLFLITYVTYHAIAGSTSFGGEGFIVFIYYFILITHIFLATALLPLALITLAHGLNNNVAKHRKIARFTMPIWLYVSVTGVVVYLMISPYY